MNEFLGGLTEVETAIVYGMGVSLFFVMVEKETWVRSGKFGRHMFRIMWRFVIVGLLTSAGVYACIRMGWIGNFDAVRERI